jgi:hypothetical protein
MRPLLHEIASEAVTDRLFGVATAEATVARLRQAGQVHALTRAIVQGGVTNDDIEAFLAEALSDYRPGLSCGADPVLAALAVALAPIPSAFADGFLRDLAVLKIREFSKSTRVASLLLRERHRRLSQTTTGMFYLSVPVPRPGQRATAKPPFRVNVNQSISRHAMAA